MTAEQALPPIDWKTLRPGSPGGSHISHDRPSAHALWKCPACTAENAGPLEDGCATCGAGKPGKFVGVDPPARPKAAETPAPITDAAASDYGFLAFIAPLRGRVDAATEQLLYQAFQAGVAWAEKTVLSRVVPQAGGVLPLAGTKESRTLVAALQYFSEAVLSQFPEEVKTGEWCSKGEVELMIKQIEGRS